MKHRSGGATTSLAIDWAPVLGAFGLALFFLAMRDQMRRGPSASWWPLRLAHAGGLTDIVALLALALGAGWCLRFVQVRFQRRLAAAERRTWQANALADENATVLRVCRTVVQEFAQPLSGALAYSELLTVGGDYASDDQRHEIEGLREGMLQLERLLLSLRTVVQNAPTGGQHRIADDVEDAVAVRRPRITVHSRTPRGLTAPPRAHFE